MRIISIPSSKSVKFVSIKPAPDETCLFEIKYYCEDRLGHSLGSLYHHIDFPASKDFLDSSISEQEIVRDILATYRLILQELYIPRSKDEDFYFEEEMDGEETNDLADFVRAKPLPSN